MPYRKKRAHERGRPPVETRLGEPQVKTVRARGGGVKVKLLSYNFANVTDPETGETTRLEILRVISNPASADYARRKILTRGAIIETPLGRARVTSRPGQNGTINAVLLK